MIRFGEAARDRDEEREGGPGESESCRNRTPGSSLDAIDESPRSRLARLYAECEVRSDHVGEIDRLYVERILDHRETYRAVGAELGIPWWFVGIIHGLESSFDFGCHLHNGDPLTGRTVRVPRGRPEAGEPPFTWHESAVDALRGQGLAGRGDWSLGAALDRLERYNGLGYRKHGRPSPYLWSYSGHYEKGKYVADGQFDPEAVSGQCGGATLIRRLEERGLIDTGRPLDGDVDRAGPGLDFPGAIARGRRDSGGVRDVRRVQEWLTLAGSRTDVDGDFGPATEAAVRDFQRRYSLPVTGTVGERTWSALTAPLRAATDPDSDHA